MLLGKRRGQLLIASGRMKQLGQNGNDTQLWMYLVVKVKFNGIKNNTAEEPGMSGPWIKANWKQSNRRWQEWTSTFYRISELKWTGMGEFNSDNHYIYYCGQESLRRNGVAIIVKKRVWNLWVWMQSPKRRNDLSSFPRQTIQYHGNPSLCPKQ